jgi:hypothetical protein
MHCPICGSEIRSDSDPHECGTQDDRLQAGSWKITPAGMCVTLITGNSYTRRKTMKPHFRNGKLTVQLHRPDEAVLRRARELGEAFSAMNQDTGKPLVDAVDAILETPVAAKQDEEE